MVTQAEQDILDAYELEILGLTEVDMSLKMEKMKARLWVDILHALYMLNDSVNRID